jgi:hypothetical protein
MVGPALNCSANAFWLVCDADHLSTGDAEDPNLLTNPGFLGAGLATLSSMPIAMVESGWVIVLFAPFIIGGIGVGIFISIVIAALRVTPVQGATFGGALGFAYACFIVFIISHYGEIPWVVPTAIYTITGAIIGWLVVLRQRER